MSVVLVTFLSIVFAWVYWHFIHLRRGQQVPTSNAPTIKSVKKKPATKETPLTTSKVEENSSKANTLKILYASQSGTSRKWANVLAERVNALENWKVSDLIDLAKFDPDELVLEVEKGPVTLLFVVSTYTEGAPPDNCAAFFRFLDDQSLDFRVPKSLYKNLSYGIFGIGNSVYGKKFNATAKALNKSLLRLSGKQLLRIGMGDNGAAAEVQPAFDPWCKHLFQVLEKKAQAPEESDDEDDSEPLADLEDIELGTMMKGKKPTIKKRARVRKANVPAEGKSEEEPELVESEDDEPEEDDDYDADEYDEDNGDYDGGEKKELLTDTLRKSLTKQGYKLIGSHSGVKMCRWTKAQLRGRGGCYKHTFYGITSYQCMEMTPSLACANKCVFCWRHHTNPVGKEWKWKMDEPQMLIENSIANHQQMIKQMRGVPGVIPERFNEAFTVRHCALSLVGEPIIYPEINKFIDMLHERNISSFMVTNAQFPEKIEQLKPVTQLYISVDAATKESLKRIDRPIFTDFWERFLSCIQQLKKKQQRTVFRLTLVKEWNMEELINYASLIEEGMPSFIEIKGVTYCGYSTASSLTMKNVPFHQEVLAYARKMIQCNPVVSEHYELVCEHEHSCCILIAKKEFKVNGVWHTWIDYPKFHQLINKGEPFTAIDYMAPTPSWSLVDSKERGFDPNETRYKRNKPYQGGGC